jgi:broad specificity phosphatase PhoE
VVAKPEECTGSPDFPAGNPALTQLGRQQARLLGQRLRYMAFRGIIYSSPYLRTLETAEIIAELTSGTVIVSDEIREINKVEENIEDVVVRVFPFVKERIADGKDCLLVGHGASAYAATRSVYDYFSMPCEKLPPDWNCNLTLLEISNGFRIKFMRDVSHIPAGMVTANTVYRKDTLI